MIEYIINSKKYGSQVVLLDDEDYERLQKHKHKLELRYDKTIKGFYVQFKVKPLGICKRKGKDMRRTIPLHRWILNCPKHLQVDHINRNPLDNRKCNLRKVTTRENNWNKRNNRSNICIGEYIKNRKWSVNITVKNKEYYFGGFNSLQDAIKKRDEFLKEVM